MSNASIIGIVNQKGGTGKTTTCANLGIDLAREGKRVMLIDCDPQGSLTISLGYPQPDTLPVTLADLMGKVLSDAPIDPGEGVLHHTEGVDLLPANIALAGMEVSLVNAMSREITLKQVIATYRKDYDYILLDCSEPFPKKRTRKFEEKQNESLSFWEMLVQAARCVRRLASNCAGECHPNAECGRTEL